LEVVVGAHDSKYYLVPWDKEVSVKNQPLNLSLLDGHLINTEFSPDCQKTADGFYAAFSEGIFYVFKNCEGTVYIGFRKKALPIAIVQNIEYSENSYGIRFSAYGEDKNAPLMAFRYRTLRRFVFNPFALFYEIFVPDDDWGLAFDLPGFVHDWYRHGVLEKNIDEFLVPGRKRV